MAAIQAPPSPVIGRAHPRPPALERRGCPVEGGTAGNLPEAWVLTTSLWVWRGVMLVWALWLAHSLIAWLGWAWANFRAAGVWRPWRKTAAGARG